MSSHGLCMGMNWRFPKISAVDSVSMGAIEFRVRSLHFSSLQAPPSDKQRQRNICKYERQI